MNGIRANAFPKVKPGNAAMYYPECNVLVNRTLDRKSKTPAFKCVVARVVPSALAEPLSNMQPRSEPALRESV